MLAGNDGDRVRVKRVMPASAEKIFDPLVDRPATRDIEVSFTE